VWKPWFVYRPTQILRRAVAALSHPSAGYQPLRTSWGATLLADPTKAIGLSIATTGVYDLAVSEALARLIAPGDTVIDAGANVGYMTVLASVAAGPQGRVLAFEPHPELFAVVQQNVDAARRRFRIARTELHNLALGSRRGAAELLLPTDFGINDGIGRIASADAVGGRSLRVSMDTLDTLLGDDSAAVLKLDVEGFELEVLRGAVRALETRRIRHIVFEDHAVDESEVVRLLRDAEYRVYSLGWTMRGPSLSPVEHGSSATVYEAPNFVASIEPDQVLERCGRKGWTVLNRWR
jgi:FkbM family methyltransferase